MENKSLPQLMLRFVFGPALIVMGLWVAYYFFVRSMVNYFYFNHQAIGQIDLFLITATSLAAGIYMIVLGSVMVIEQKAYHSSFVKVAAFCYTLFISPFVAMFYDNVGVYIVLAIGYAGLYLSYKRLVGKEASPS